MITSDSTATASFASQCVALQAFDYAVALSWPPHAERLVLQTVPTPPLLQFAYFSLHQSIPPSLRQRPLLLSSLQLYLWIALLVLCTAPYRDKPIFRIQPKRPKVYPKKRHRTNTLTNACQKPHPLEQDSVTADAICCCPSPNRPSLCCR